jgi:hypothetical protein
MRTSIVGKGLSRQDAQSVADILETIRQPGQGAKARELLDASRPPDSPTHGLFEWDDSLAAEKHRLERAHQLIRQVEIIIQRDPMDSPRRVRAFVSMPSSSGRSYVPTVEVLSDERLREQLLMLAKAELAAFQAKYAALEELSLVFAAIQEVHQQAA